MGLFYDFFVVFFRFGVVVLFCICFCFVFVFVGVFCGFLLLVFLGCLFGVGFFFLGGFGGD